MSIFRFRNPRGILAIALATLSSGSITADVTAAPMIKDGDVIAIIGDSITEGRQFSAFVEDYLLMCQPAKVRAMQFGWSGEAVNGFNSRIPDFLTMKPTVATLCYGMNDGMYKPVDDQIRKLYHDGLLQGVKALQAGGVRVMVGSPGCVDTTTFARPTVTAAAYNENLAALRDEAKMVATETGSNFADVHSAMFKAMAPVKAKYGQSYPFVGADGVHPRANGGLVMAYAILKGLGFEGDLGTITVDLAAEHATARGGHKVVSVGGNKVTIESTTYPFCFAGDPKDPGGTLDMIDFVPFNADLNRLTLVATGPAKRYHVSWGKTTKLFSAEQLKAGINLAGEFTDNPFVKPFMAVHQKVMDKQGSENLLLKQLLHSIIAGHKIMLDHDKDLNTVAAAIPPAQAKFAADVAAAVIPVTHTITFEAAE